MARSREKAPPAQPAPPEPFVLVVEDELELGRLLTATLNANGFDARLATSGEEALRYVLADAPALIVLDVLLPGISGLEVCARLRAEPDYHQLPIMLVSGRAADVDRIKGLEAGADDFLAKPYNPRELILRMRRLLRPVEEVVPQALSCGPIALDATGRLRVSGKVVHATVVELRLLRDLLRNRGQMRTREQLLQVVWATSDTSRRVDTHVNRLRNKLGAAGRLLETVRGFGYRIK
jgi:two-component system phosphate regulon response regulator PhoB